MNEQTSLVKKKVYLTLICLTIGTLLFIFGLSYTEQNVLLTTNYIFAMVLFVLSFITIHKTLKTDQYKILKYMWALDLFFIVLCSVVYFVRVFA